MRSKSHDQRKGQWMYNKIREDKPERNSENEEQMIADVLWDMENDEFDRIMEGYDK